MLMLSVMLSAAACTIELDGGSTARLLAPKDVTAVSPTEGAEKPMPSEAGEDNTAPEEDDPQETLPQPSTPQEPDVQEPAPEEPDVQEPAPEEPTPPVTPGEDNSAYQVAEGCIYIMEDGTVRMAGEYMPAKPSRGDEYITREYTYKYGYYYSKTFIVKWLDFSQPQLDGWGVKVNDQTKTHYAPLEASINGAPLVSIRDCFYKCENLIQSPEIPDSVMDMVQAFSRCTSLVTVTNLPRKMLWSEYAFSYCTALTKTPAFPDGLESMSCLFSCCTALVEVMDIPDSVRDMSSTFYGCTALKTAPKLPNGITCISSTFSGCTALTQAPEIPASVVEMNTTFSGCTGLSTLPDVPGNVRMMDNAFANCTGVTQGPQIAEGPVNMKGVFAGCTNLQVAPRIPNSARDITGLFENCTSLQTAPAIPEGITELNGVFRGCVSLKSAPEIPGSVTALVETFRGCDRLETAPMIPKSVTSMVRAFERCWQLAGTVEIHADLKFEPCGGQCSNCRSDESRCFFCSSCFSGASCFNQTGQLIVITGSCAYKEELASTGGAFVMADEVDGAVVADAIDIVSTGQRYENIYNAPDYIASGETAVPGAACAFRVEQTCYLETVVDSQIGVEAVEILGVRINGKECSVYQTKTEAQKEELMGSMGYVEGDWKSLVVYLVISPEIEAVVGESYTYADVVYETDCRVRLKCGYTVDVTIVQDQVFFTNYDRLDTTPEDY